MKRKINVIGKICRIISMVIIVLLMIGASASLISSIVLIVIPQNGMQADVTGAAKVEVYGDIIDSLPTGTFNDIAQSIREGSTKLKINSNKVTDITQTENGIVLDASGEVLHLTFRR